MTHYLPKSDRIKITYNKDSVHVENSFCLTKRKEMRQWIDVIKNCKECPQVVSQRSDRSLLREWEAHNWFYCHGYKVERTMHVDFDAEPPMRLLAYAILSVIYRMRII